MHFCSSCGGSLGSRYHEVAHAPDVETASREDLEAAADIHERTAAEYLAQHGGYQHVCSGPGDKCIYLSTHALRRDPDA